MTRYEDELAAGLRELGVTVDRVRRRPDPILGNTVASWLTRYRSTGVDLVHGTFQTVAPAGFLHRASPFVVTVHDLAPLVYPEEVDDISTRLQWLLTPKALRRADRIIAISEFTKRELHRLLDVPATDVTVVHQGVDHTTYRPLNQAYCRNHFDLDPKVDYVLVVSSNEIHKRADDVPGVLHQVRAELGDVKLLKAGYGTELAGEDVVTTGWVDEADMPKLYNAADVYLHPSEYEGFGLPILEAMACGTPVASRAVASVPEIVGDVYDLAPADAEPAQLAEQVISRLRGRSDDTDERAVTRSREFPWSRTARKTRAVYEEVLAACGS